MEIEDSVLMNYKVNGSPLQFARLIIHYLCGKEYDIKLDPIEEEFLKKMVDTAENNELDYRQFNEILLLLRQDKIERGFFQFLFEKDTINLTDLIKGISKFRVFAMLCFGNFRFAYKKLSKSSQYEIKKILSPYCQDACFMEKEFLERREKMLEIEKIPRDKTWFLGSLSGKKVEKEASEVEKRIKNGDIKDPQKYIDGISEITKNIQAIQEIAFKNTDVYLTWDHMDVYIATSMRNKWEYEETFDFIKNIFEDELSDLNIRYFDPTQSKCKNIRDKGLIEGLMLKRARCTIYLAQENDTMGKDSELATTLAQSKPVIAFVPEIDPKEYSKKIRSRSLDYFKKRFLMLDADGVLDEDELRSIIKKEFPNFDEKIDEFMDELSKFQNENPFPIILENENEFKEGVNFQEICDVIALSEQYYYNVRADILREGHPLSMQVDLTTGVANGVLVVRTPSQCATLLRAILTNNLKLCIREESDFTVLIENISNSPLRVVTKNERLTNSFWNLFV
jgi:hypothetical protein